MTEILRGFMSKKFSGGFPRTFMYEGYICVCIQKNTYLSRRPVSSSFHNHDGYSNALSVRVWLLEEHFCVSHFWKTCNSSIMSYSKSCRLWLFDYVVIISKSCNHIHSVHIGLYLMSIPTHVDCKHVDSDSYRSCLRFVHDPLW